MEITKTGPPKYIIYLGTMRLPDGNAAAHRGVGICRLCSKIGFAPVLIGVSDDPGARGDVLKTRFTFEGLAAYSLPYPRGAGEWLRHIASIRRIERVMNDLGIQNIHAVIAMDYHAIALARLIRLCRRRRVFLIADTLDWFGKSRDPFPRNWVKDFDTALRMKRLHKKTARVIAASRYLYDYYQKDVPALELIPPCADPSGAKFQDMPGFAPHTPPEFSFVGSPDPQFSHERLDWLIRAACEMNRKGLPCRVNIVGMDRAALVEMHPALVNLKEFDTCVQCLGRRPHDECLKIIAQSDFTVIIREDTLLSRAGFSTKFAESFACGTPVLITPTSNMRDYLIDGVNGFASENCTYESFCTAFETLLRKVLPGDVARMHAQIPQNNPLLYDRYLENLKRLLCPENAL